MALAYNIALAVAGPIFVAFLIVALSIALDRLLLATNSLVKTLQNGEVGPLLWILLWLVFGWVLLFAVSDGLPLVTSTSIDFRCMRSIAIG